MGNALLGLIGILAITQAAQDGVGEQARPASQENAAPADDKQSNEIVVIGRRGDAAVAAESEFDEDDIAADGSETIQELLLKLQPFIDPTGAQPIILINGKPAGFDTSILSYPTRALVRVAVLKPEAGARYGTKASARVVNLVLKPKFASLEAEAAVNAATAGGQYGGSLGATRSAINGDTRWNLRAQFGRQGALLKSARRIPRNVGDSTTINPLAGVGGARMASAREGITATATSRDPIDPDDFETLQPSTGNTSLGINLARPLGNFAASLTLNASRSESESLRGIPKLLLALPTDRSWPADGASASQYQSFPGARALRGTSNTQTLGATLTLTGAIFGVQTSLAATFSNSDSKDRIETGTDIAKLQAIYSDGSDFDSRTYLSDSFLNFRQSHSRSNNLGFRLTLQKVMLELPGGPLSWSFSSTANRGNSGITQDENKALTSTRSTYAQSSSQVSVNLPISGQGSAFAALRDLSIDLSVGRQSTAGGGAETSYSGGVSWTPFTQIQVRGSVDIAPNPPSFDQLNGPIITTVNRFFDYAQQEFVEPTWITGGNPLLVRGGQTALSVSMMVRPFRRQELAINFAYRQFVATDSPVTFSELTPAIEAAFPERVTRDKEGRLIEVDARPINVERQKDANLSSSLTLRLGGARRRRPGAMALNPASDRPQVNLALGYQLRLQSDTLIRRGLPVINRLDASQASRHAVDLRIGVGKRAFGGSLSTSWNSPARVLGSGGAFRLTPPLTFNLSSFADLARLLKAPQLNAWAQGTNVSLDIQNLFESYRRIALPDGSVPAGYSRDEVDPLGRTVRLTLRKQF